MPLPFFLAGILRKAAAGALAKGVTAKASAAGAKALVGHHHGFAQQVAGKLAEKASDAAVDSTLSRREKKTERR